jgi:hypothetical protein
MPTAPTIKAGSRGWNPSAGYEGVLAALKPLNYGDKIWKYYIDRYPTASIVMKVSRKPSISAAWSNFTKDALPHFAVAEATATASGTTLTAMFTSHYTRFLLYDTWMNLRTHETIMVTSTPAANMVVSRSFGRVPGQAIVVGDKFVRVNQARPEGSTAATALSTIEVEHKFTAAEMSVVAELTDRLAATRMLINPNLRAEGIADARYEFLRAQKLSYFLGGMGLVQATTGEQTGVKGLMDHIETNRLTLNDVLVYSELNSFIGDAIAPNNPDTTIIGATSNRVKSIISSWGLENLTVNAEKLSKEWGYEIDSVHIVGGRKLALVTESFFDENETMQGWMFLLSPKMSQWRPVIGNGINGDVHLNKDIKTDDGYKGKKDEWYAMAGWEHGAERAYGFIDGINY